LFLDVGTPETQAKFFYNSLKHRPALLYRLTAHQSNSKPLSSPVWSSMLHLPTDGLQPPSRPTHTLPSCTTTMTSWPAIHAHNTSTPGLPKNTSMPEHTKSAKHLEIIHSLPDNGLNVDGIQVNDTPTNEVFWQERLLFAGSFPD